MMVEKSLKPGAVIIDPGTNKNALCLADNPTSLSFQLRDISHTHDGLKSITAKFSYLLSKIQSIRKNLINSNCQKNSVKMKGDKN